MKKKRPDIVDRLGVERVRFLVKRHQQDRLNMLVGLLAWFGILAMVAGFACVGCITWAW